MSDENHDARTKFSSLPKTVFGFALMGVFLWLTFRQIPFGEFVSVFRKVRWLPVFSAMLLQLTAHAFRAWRWKLLLQVSHPELKRRRAFSSLMVGYAVNFVLPRGGEVARALHLRKTAGTPVSAGLGSVLTERFLDMACLVILFPLLSILYQDRLERIFPGLGGGITLAAAAAVLGLGLIWWFGKNPEQASGRLQRLAGRFGLPLSERALRIGTGILKGFSGLFLRENSLRIASLSGAIWLFYALSNWAMFHSLPLGASPALGFSDSLALTVVVAVAFALPSPGGTGTAHYFSSRFLVGLFSVPHPEALAFATLLHAASNLPAVLLGAIFSARAMLTGKSQNPDNQATG